ncbi:ATP-dependent helicase [Azospirillum sp. B4]|uniref:ATP-dependent helicase n=1 Tax=Azospirillum sp. B4 TaxID=95605 RepID=UPI00034C18FF|nr:ATP-dependent helicase [Azospirillum sp. B4]
MPSKNQERQLGEPIRTSEAPRDSPPADRPAWLQGLNDEQLLAATCLDGPVQVLAGAGSGKTKVVVARATEAIRTKRVKASRCLIISFSSDAVEEVKTRLNGALGARADAVRVATFHSLFKSLLSLKPSVAGLRPGFAVYGSDDGDRLVRPLLEDLVEGGHPVPAGRGGKAAKMTELVRGVLSAISFMKRQGFLPRRAQQQLKDHDSPFIQIALKVYPAYQAALQSENAADFDDLLLLPIMAMGRSERLRREWSGFWELVMVDEYQDTDPLQEQGLALLAFYHRNLCVVGDQRQAIYAFRGATAANICGFKDRWPDATVIALKFNYRNNPEILAAANHLAANSNSPVGAPLTAGSSMTPLDRGVVVIECEDDEEAAARAIDVAVADMDALRFLSGGAKGGRAFLLYRSNLDAELLITAAVRKGLTYRVVGELGFYSREEVKDALAFISLMENPRDLEAFRRIANKPSRGLGDQSVSRLSASAEDWLAKDAEGEGAPEQDGILDLALPLPKLDRRGLEGLEVLRGALQSWREGRGRPLHNRIEALLELLGYERHWAGSTEGEREERAANLDRLLDTASTMPSAGALLEHASRAASSLQQDAALVLMTLHKAKGLEEDVVVLPFWTEERFPTRAAIAAAKEAGRGADASSLPEDEARVFDPDDPIVVERNLAYVGVTRGRHRVTILTHRQTSKGKAMPSRFIAEMGPHVTWVA